MYHDDRDAGNVPSITQCQRSSNNQTELLYGRWEDLEIMVGPIYMTYDPEKHHQLRRLKNSYTERGENRLVLLYVSWRSTDTMKRGESLHVCIISKGFLLLNWGKDPTFMECRRYNYLHCRTGWMYSRLESL